MIYVIKQGEHYASNRRFVPYFKDHLNFSFKFNDSALYESSQDEYNHAFDVNKIYGFREGFSNDNSARLGWNCVDGKLYVYPYVHVNGEIYNKTSIESIGEIEIGKLYNCSILCSKDVYIFKVSNTNIPVTVPRGKPSWFKFIENAYFGGIYTAPHDITIEVIRN